MSSSDVINSHDLVKLANVLPNYESNQIVLEGDKPLQMTGSVDHSDLKCKGVLMFSNDNNNDEDGYGQTINQMDVTDHNIMALEYEDNAIQNGPELIFLLTAPFDEEAKTGDGQYAASLVAGFQQYGQPVDCIWLREQNNHYYLPEFAGLSPVPARCIPSIFVLQSVANGRPVLSGYRYSYTENLDELLCYVASQTTLATPKVLIDSNNQLTHVFYYCLGDQTTFFLTPGQVLSLKNNLDRLSGSYKDRILFLKDKQEKLTSELKALQNVPKTVFKNAKDDINQITRQLKNWHIKVDEIDKWNACLSQLEEQFNSDSVNEPVLLKALNTLSFIQGRCLQDIDALFKPLAKPLPGTIFQQALEVARQDGCRKHLVNQLLSTMKVLAHGRTCGIDIHVRPPETGAYVMPEDILAFQQAGIAVNVTVHEYKQNYTRPHLQKMTHDLLNVANSVLFFNEKDRSDAIRASLEGCLVFSKWAKGEKRHPIQSYNLEGKARGLTVASQLLSGTPDDILTVLAKAPNILCFGTIRPGKGFEEAIGIAEEIKIREAIIVEETIPTVILAGDPQDPGLMYRIFVVRYGKDVTDHFMSSNPYCLTEQQCGEKRDYWKVARQVLEQSVASNTSTLANPYLDIHPWCEAGELAQLKQNSKYVCRIDDMGMRNNGSAIISVLDVGIVYTKWGCVTDNEYLSNGKYAGAVDLGDVKYGVNKAKKFFHQQAGVLSNYRRAPFPRLASELLESVLARELNQRMYAQSIEESDNYQSVKKAQNLLSEKFTLANSVQHLKAVFTIDHPKPATTVSLNKKPGFFNAKSVSNKAECPNSVISGSAIVEF